MNKRCRDLPAQSLGASTKFKISPRMGYRGIEAEVLSIFTILCHEQLSIF